MRVSVQERYSHYTVCKTNFEGELPTLPLNLGGDEGGSSQWPPEALRRSRIFFFSYLVSISFPIEFDVWGRLCTHFEAAKVRNFATVTQHFSV